MTDKEVSRYETISSRNILDETACMSGFTHKQSLLFSKINSLKMYHQSLPFLTGIIKTLVVALLVMIRH